MGGAQECRRQYMDLCASYSWNPSDDWKDLFAYDGFLYEGSLEVNDNIAAVSRYFNLSPFANDCASHTSGQYEIVQNHLRF